MSPLWLRPKVLHHIGFFKGSLSVRFRNWQNFYSTSLCIVLVLAEIIKAAFEYRVFMAVLYQVYNTYISDWNDIKIEKAISVLYYVPLWWHRLRRAGNFVEGLHPLEHVSTWWNLLCADRFNQPPLPRSGWLVENLPTLHLCHRALGICNRLCGKSVAGLECLELLQPSLQFNGAGLPHLHGSVVSAFYSRGRICPQDERPPLHCYGDNSAVGRAGGLPSPAPFLYILCASFCQFVCVYRNSSNCLLQLSHNNWYFITISNFPSFILHFVTKRYEEVSCL